MPEEQVQTLLMLASECAMLTIKVQNERSLFPKGPEKGKLRRIGLQLDEATAALKRAVDILGGTNG